MMIRLVYLQNLLIVFQFECDIAQYFFFEICMTTQISSRYAITTRLIRVCLVRFQENNDIIFFYRRRSTNFKKNYTFIDIDPFKSSAISVDGQGHHTIQIRILLLPLFNTLSFFIRSTESTVFRYDSLLKQHRKEP